MTTASSAVLEYHCYHQHDTVASPKNPLTTDHTPRKKPPSVHPRLPFCIPNPHTANTTSSKPATAIVQTTTRSQNRLNPKKYLSTRPTTAKTWIHPPAKRSKEKKEEAKHHPQPQAPEPTKTSTIHTVNPSVVPTDPGPQTPVPTSPLSKTGTTKCGSRRKKTKKEKAEEEQKERRHKRDGKSREGRGGGKREPRGRRGGGGASPRLKP